MCRPAAVVAVLIAWGLVAPHALATPAATVSPQPGTAFNLPQTQISFLGVAPRLLRGIRVTGALSGAHPGVLRRYASQPGASFVPDTPFVPGETVTVDARVPVSGARHGRFSFTIAWTEDLSPSPVRAGPPPPSVGPAASWNPVQSFRSRPDLLPPALDVAAGHAAQDEGDFFVAPQRSRPESGPMILDPRGRLVWFDPVRAAETADFRRQSLHGRPVLSWWQGFMVNGHDVGYGVVLDDHYRQIATAYAGNGLAMDLHEFLLTDRGAAYIVALSPVVLPGFAEPVLDNVVQEIDLTTGLVMFEWHALDHIPPSNSYLSPALSTPEMDPEFDPYHLNSISLERSGTLILSVRNTSSISAVNPRTGDVLWTLGGKHSSFKVTAGSQPAFQHDATAQPDGTLTVFDNGGENLEQFTGPARLEPDSRALQLALNTRTMTATVVHAYHHRPPLASDYEGDVQVLADGNALVGWGQQPYFSEYTASGRQDFDAHFINAGTTYRAYRFIWQGFPLTGPDVAAASGRTGEMVYASWNGATDVQAWRVLVGYSRARLRPVTVARREGFETTIRVPGSYRYVAVQALASDRAVLGASAVVPVSRG